MSYWKGTKHLVLFLRSILLKTIERYAENVAKTCIIIIVVKTGVAFTDRLRQFRLTVFLHPRPGLSLVLFEQLFDVPCSFSFCFSMTRFLGCPTCRQSVPASFRGYVKVLRFAVEVSRRSVSYEPHQKCSLSASFFLHVHFEDLLGGKSCKTKEGRPVLHGVILLRNSSHAFNVQDMVNHIQVDNTSDLPGSWPSQPPPASLRFFP
ncbi:hypothetical protein BV898_05668 [Hypsibius exemplaris]|uniref:Uncharacterized protein n=1 Tax=Hypsibius exemplaris TaxID=2072580 RepID=A0A1W0WYV1_HYPEX|nr:hypothetical protein BV898_05668 [Hypsibius exemplaris]